MHAARRSCTFLFLFSCLRGWRAQELKGNIRVFCRVRPPGVVVADLPAPDSGSGSGSAEDAGMAVDFPTSGDLLGRGLHLTVGEPARQLGSQACGWPGAERPLRDSEGRAGEGRAAAQQHRARRGMCAGAHE